MLENPTEEALEEHRRRMEEMIDALAPGEENAWDRSDLVEAIDDYDFAVRTYAISRQGRTILAAITGDLTIDDDGRALWDEAEEVAP